MSFIREGGSEPAIMGLIISYVVDGLNGSIKYNIEQKHKTFDQAMKTSTRFIYNTLKYQVVKYVGAFNLMYKYWKSARYNIPFEDVIGLDLMLLKFEYNTSSKLGRIASDFGVPQKLVRYYDLLNVNERSASLLQTQFDQYEQREFKKIQSIVRDTI